MSCLTRFACRFVWAAAGLVPAIAMAQEIDVRTGEHGSFTRIVIDFPRRPEWTIGRRDQSYELNVDDPDIRFGLGDAFRRIGNGRISNLTDLGAGRLRIEVACECNLTVEPLPNQGLVIDVVDGSPAADNPWEQSLVRTTANERTRVRSVPKAVLPVVLPPVASVPNLGPLATATDQALSLEELGRVQEVLKGLLDQSSRAASQGLIKFDTPGIDRAGPGPDSAAVEEDASSDALEIAPRPIDMAKNITVETQIDRDSRSGRSGMARTSQVSCLDTRLVDVGEWYDLDDVRDSLGLARMNLVDSRDRPDPLAYAEMARKLIFLSFGREAVALLDEGPDGIPDKALLIELAQLMEFDKPQHLAPILANQINCDTPAALWAVLATGSAEDGNVLDVANVVRSFSAMPLHLRQYLGPRIASRMIDRGNQEAALSIRNAILRGATSSTPDVTMLEAELDTLNGDLVSAEQALKDVAVSTGRRAAEALAQLIENRISDGRTVETDLIDQGSALAFEQGNAPAARRLSQAILKARISRKEFDLALDLAKDLQRRETFGADEVRDMRSTILFALAETADDPTFLPIALREIAAEPLSDPSRIPLAARLASFQMPGPAREALGTGSDIPLEEERYVLAEIAILESKRSIAESYLTGLETDQADELRRRAEAIGEPAPPDGTVQTALETGDIASQSDGYPEPEQGVLERNQALLTDSRAIRESLQALLREQGN